MSRQANTPAVASARPKRVPLSGRNRLSVKDRDPNYVYRVVNDVDDRVERLQELGYEIDPKAQVGDKRVDNSSSLGSVSTVSVGQGIRAVVMRQRKDYYDEDQNTKMAQLAEVEATMKKKDVDYGTFGYEK
jgi:hypothetical protein